MLRSLAMRLYYLFKALRLLWGDAAYLIPSRVAHFQMRLWRASSLSDYQLQSFIAWHCHQMEKATKQLSKGSGENSRGRTPPSPSWPARSRSSRTSTRFAIR